MNNNPTTHDADSNQGRFWYLIDAAISGSLADAELRELEALLLADHNLRQQYLEYAQLHYELEFLHLAQQAVEAVRSQGSGVRGQESGVRGQGSEAGAGIRGQSQKRDLRRVLRVVLALALSLLVLVGVAGFAIWGRVGREQPSVVQAPAAIVATLVRDNGAQWDPAFAPAGKDLTAAQRLKLTSGLVEIAFVSQARIILEGPADLTVGQLKSEDRTRKSGIENSCFLASGMLTAFIPAAAHGFTVHTSHGTATDLGTEFGVLVKSEVGNRRSDSEKPTSDPRSPTSTEVHVFRGRVEVAEGYNLPPSEIKSHQSEILTSGQAVMIDHSGLERLPAADAFRFRTDVFEGQSRQLLLTEDFESMNVGDSGHSIGPWRAAYIADPHQVIRVVDPSTAAAGLSPVLPSTSHRAMEFANTGKVIGKQRRQLNAILSRDLDSNQLPARGKLLLECDISPRTSIVEPSISITADHPLRLSPGLALSEEADPAAEKIPWETDHWYRLRVVWDLDGGAPRGATVERFKWRASGGWMRDLSVQLPAPKLVDAPLGQVCFGFPAPIMGKAGGRFWLDNVRIEVIAEK
ncbi:MAG: hypothetical protein K8T91_07855 [Planctomycetes bacterium]|nr:hypothetical protein [Planctomycetota bacterium]